MEVEINRMYNLGVGIGLALTAPQSMSVVTCKQFIGELVYGQVAALWARDDVMDALRDAGLIKPRHTAKRITEIIVTEATIAELQTLVFSRFEGFEHVVLAALAV